MKNFYLNTKFKRNTKRFLIIIAAATATATATATAAAAVGVVAATTTTAADTDTDTDTDTNTDTDIDTINILLLYQLISTAIVITRLLFFSNIYQGTKLRQNENDSTYTQLLPFIKFQRIFGLQISNC